jgi:kumamolisin
VADSHILLANSERSRRKDTERVRDVAPDSVIELTLTLRVPELPDLDASRAALTSDELARLATSNEDLARVSKVMQEFGLTVVSTDPLTRTTEVSGTARQIEEAFRPNLGIYRAPGQGEFRGREGSVSVPAELNGIVTGVFGLDQRRVARRSRGRLARKQNGAGEAAAPLTPAEVAQHYDFPAEPAAGAKVGIIEFGGAYLPQELDAFVKRYGLTPPAMTIIDVGLKPPTVAEIEQLPKEEADFIIGEAIEVMMDIEVVAGQCPGAEIVVYFANFDERGWIRLINRLVKERDGAPHVLSISWGAPEDDPKGWSRAAVEAISERLGILARMGVTVCVASGDDGSGDAVEDNRAHVDFPASSPYVLSVGGTMLEGGTDVVWWEDPGHRTPHGGGATGGGVSEVFPRPAWQDVDVESMNSPPGGGRIVPDVAALAGSPFYALAIPAQEQFNGGTSAAAPLWASLIATALALGKPSKGPTFLTPLLYEGGSKPRGETACTDVKEGQNASQPNPGFGYKSKNGYDAVSGWGVPKGTDLVAILP